MTFSAARLPFASTGQFSSLFLDYVSGKEALKPFYEQAPDDNGLAAAGGKLIYDEKNRPLLVNALRSQYADAGVAVNESLLSALAAEGTCTVCTGHQLCLFTGPLYFIYKIITTIKLAEEQSDKLRRPVVPVYWMASEDHDFEEVRSVNLFGKKLQWEMVAAGAVGKLRTDSLAPLLGELKNVMGVSVHADELFGKIAAAYRPGRTLAQATREFVNTIFGGRLLILDGDDASLKKSFAEVMKADVLENKPYALVSESIQALGQIGYENQVNPRKINLFYMKEGLRGRIEEQEGKYVVLNTVMAFTKEELLKEIDTHPEFFSPNVVLRPLYQQLIMPNIAYVGGPGEIAYWLQYRKMFAHFRIAFPVLVPRNFVVLLDANSEAKLKKTGLEPSALFGNSDELVKKMIMGNAEAEVSLEAEKVELMHVFAKVNQKAAAADATLKAAADAELQRTLKSMEVLEGKMLRAEKQKQEAAVNQLKKIREKMLPGNVLQERVENFIPFYLKYGKDFFDGLSGLFDVGAHTLLLVTEHS